jgi:hypothetical protein
VIILEPVIETYDAKRFGVWPVGTRLDFEGLVLSGELASADVGTVMAVIAVCNGIAPYGEEDEHLSPAELIQRIIQTEEDADSLWAPGGLRVRDTATGLTVSPGCCCGLEGWQEWNQVAAGQSPWDIWLGHDPTPWVEHLGHKIRVWPDGGPGGYEAGPPAGTSPIEIPVSDLPGLIAGAHKQLQDFLDLLEPWARPLAGATAASLGHALAAHFHVNRSATTP